MSLLPLLVGLVQMTGLLAVTGCVARWLRPTAPALAAKVGVLGLLLSLSLLVISLADLPRPWETEIGTAAKSTRRAPGTSLVSAVSVATGVESPIATQRGGATDPPALISLNGLVSLLESSELTPPQDTAGASSVFLACVLLLAAAGLFPALLGLAATIQLHRRSRPVRPSDSDRLCTLAGVATARPVDFRTSGFTNAPCVTLTGGRTIYLPEGWQDWEEDELRASIAHELEHLKRRDPLVRLVSQVAASAQRFHPLAGRLHRGVVLSQEMAADRHAADRPVVGTKRQEYAATLSRIALRIDTQLHPRSSRIAGWILGTGTVSVSSSQLIRRIEMLTRPSTEWSPNRRRWFGTAAMLSVVGLWMLSAGWTVRAQPPKEVEAEDLPQTPRVARLPDRGQPAADADHSASRPAAQPWKDLRENNSGYAVIHIDALLKRIPMLQQLIAKGAEQQLDLAWNSVTLEEKNSNRESLGLTIANLKTIATGVEFTLTKVPPKEENEKTTKMSFGSKNARVWFQTPVDHDPIKDALDVDRISGMLAASGTSTEDLGGLTYEKFTRLMIDGILTAGATTDSLGFTPKEEDDDSPHDPKQFARLQSAFKRVDGGEITVCFSLPGGLGHLANRDDEITDALIKHAACIGIGLSVGEDQNATTKIALVPRAGTDAAELNAAVIAAEERLVQKLDALIKDGDTAIQGQLAKRVFDTRVVHAAEPSDGDNDGAVLIEVEFPIAAFALFFL